MMDYAAKFQDLWDRTPDMGCMTLPGGFFPITRPLSFVNKTVRIESYGTTCLVWKPEKPDPAAWCMTIGATDDAKKSQKGGSVRDVWIMGENPGTPGGCLRIRNAREWTFYELLVNYCERGVLIDSSPDTYSMNNDFYVKEIGADKLALEIGGQPGSNKNNVQTFYGGHWAAGEGGTVVRMIDGGQGSVFFKPTMENAVDEITWFDIGCGGAQTTIFWPWLETNDVKKPGKIWLQPDSFGVRYYPARGWGWEWHDRGRDNQVMHYPIYFLHGLGA